MSTRDIAIVIPARLDSKRLKKKLLIKVNGLEMIEHVRRRALLNSFHAPVIVVSGDEEIISTIKKYGGKCLRTYQKHENGFSRITEAHQKLNYSRYILLQGDELLINPKYLDAIQTAIISKDEYFYNTVSRINQIKELSDVNIVKCVLSANKNINYMFRISPFISTKRNQLKFVYKVNGLFGFTKKTLENLNTKFLSLKSMGESIEQLSFLDQNFTIRAVEVDRSFPSVNVKSDLSLAIKLLKSDNVQRNIMINVY